MVLVYHNITPPQYFLGVHPLLVQLCFLGRRELAPIASRCVLALGDSEFNRQELEELGFPRHGGPAGRPELRRISTSTANRMLTGEFDDGWTNILFVGRIIPNKKIEDVIRFFHAYRTRYNPRSRLLLVGSYRRLRVVLRDAAAADRAAGRPRRVLPRPRQQRGARRPSTTFGDLFLCASEHEGFCVPLMEAFHTRMPVIAYAATAMPSTMDGGGVLYDDEGFARIAAADGCDPRRRGARGPRYSRARMRRSPGWSRRDFAGLVLSFVERGARRAAAAGARGDVRLLGSVRVAANSSRRSVNTGRRLIAVSPQRDQRNQLEQRGINRSRNPQNQWKSRNRISRSGLVWSCSLIHVIPDLHFLTPIPFL